MKKLVLLTMLCPLLLGVTLTNSAPESTKVVDDTVLLEDDLLVYASAERGMPSKVVKNAVVGDSTTAYSQTFYQYGTNSTSGNSIIRFATAVKGDLKTLSYDLTYSGNTYQVDIPTVYKGITVNGVSTYYGENGETTNADEATYYWACFTLEFKSDAQVDTRFYAKLNIEDKAGETYVTEQRSTSLGMLKYDYEVAFDGVMDDAIWTDAVKANKWTARNDNVATIDFYATRTSKGLYFFADYAGSSDYTSATEWWKGNNFEITITNHTGRLFNKKEKEANTSSQYQFWASSYTNSTLHNFELGYVSPAAVYNSETAKYEVKFELFVSYDTVYASVSDPFGFGFGSNPGGSAWVNSHYHYSDDLTINKKISVDGIKDMLTVDECPHGYGDWTTTVEVTCGTDGEQERTCKGCGNVETQVVTSTGEHNWNYSDVTTITASTCTTQGTGTIPCYANCGHTTEVALPLDEDNHTQEYDATAGEYPCCGERVQEGSPIVNSVNNEIWGWGNAASWTNVAKNLTGDYSVTVKYTSKTNTNVATTSDVAAHTLVVVSEQLPEGSTGYGSPWVSRMDWWQWCDQWQSTERLTDELNKADGGGNGGVDGYNDICWAADFENDYKTTFMDCDVTLTYSRTGTTLRNDYIITSNSTGKVYTYWTEIHNVPTTKNITLSLVAEKSTFTINSIKYNNVTFA